MALSVIVIPGDGVTTQHNIPFALGYLREEDVKCRVGDEVDGTGNPVYRALTFLSEEVVQVAGTPAPVGVDYVFTRSVARDSLIVNYEDGAVQNEENLNAAQKQSLMLVHEVLDGRFEQFQSDVGLGGFRITDMGNPVNAQDGATKAYVDGQFSSNAANLAAAVAARDSAIAAQNAAQGSAASAATNANTASTAATNALSSQTAAAASAGNAGTSATNAAASAAAALASQNAGAGYVAQSADNAADAEAARVASEAARDISNASAGSATGSASAAAGSASAASGSAGAASASASSASGSASTATARAADALAYRDDAYDWANANEDASVTDGTHTGFSAYHWSKKAEQAAGGGVSNIGALTGEITPAALKTELSLNNVNNTADADKPISTATQTALNAKAATTYVDSAVNALDTRVDALEAAPAPVTGKPRAIVKFTSSGTYTKPAGLVAAKITCVGGGGGSGGRANVSSSTSGGSAGGGGQTAISVLDASAFGATVTITVGAAGTAGAATPTAGGAGGNTTFGALVAAEGGRGGESHGSLTDVATATNGGGATGSGTGQLLRVGGFGTPRRAGYGAVPSGGTSLHPGAMSTVSQTDPTPIVPANTGIGGPKKDYTTGTGAGQAGSAGIVIIEEFY